MKERGREVRSEGVVNRYAPASLKIYFEEFVPKSIPSLMNRRKTSTNHRMGRDTENSKRTVRVENIYLILTSR